MTQHTLTAERARTLFLYDRETGELRRNVSVRGMKPNGPVGWISRGRNYVCVDYVKHLAYRLCWLIHYGEHPSGVIDHINGNTLDNRLCNLRDVSESVNSQNRAGRQANNTSGYLGVDFHKPSKKWRAKIGIGRKSIFIGLYDDPKEAHSKYMEVRRQLHPGNTL